MIRIKKIKRGLLPALILTLSLGPFSNTLLAQQQVKSLIAVRPGYFIAKLDNSFEVVAQQEYPVTLDQLHAYIQVFNQERRPIAIKQWKNSFVIRPDTVGIVEIDVALKDTVETKRIRVKPIKAVGRLGNYTANQNIKIGIGAFKAQEGIKAVIENYDIDAYCKVYGFEVIRVSKWDEVERSVNTGARFNGATRAIINHASTGDLFIFRRIMYRCPGSEEIQRLEDMTFEIK